MTSARWYETTDGESVVFGLQMRFQAYLNEFAVTSVPSWNFSPFLMWKVQVSAESFESQDSAVSGLSSSVE